MNEHVAVALAERSYKIHVGPSLLANAGALLAPFARGPVPVITDANVSGLHLSHLMDALRGKGIDAKPIVLAPGEATKSFDHLEDLTSALLASGVDRGGLIIAFGGGVIGDLVGFAAGILKRGVDFAQIPTTLLAQVDSSVGGKTAINTAEGKNLVGLFHQPRIVLADTALLKTLPRRELLAGYAEVVKYGALGDAEFFRWLEENGGRALAHEDEAIVHAVAHSCRMKAEIVSRDERETGDRALLNFGHTFAHALEAATGYSDRLLHGEAVAIGMVLAIQLSIALGLCSSGDLERLRRHLSAVGLPTSIAAIPGTRPARDTLLAHMAHDKKVKDGRLVFVLTRGIGRTFISADVPVEHVRALLGA